MELGSKRRAPAEGAVEASSTAQQPPAKLAKLGEDRVARMSTGANLIERDGKSCTHEVAWPPGQEASSLPPSAQPGSTPAREYPFKIDPFQETAINCLEAGHNVLVSAHTSAGKTVVAEYAFAMALRDKTRVVYTSPLKALSNQKYRELYEEFGDVGLMTGDVTINPNASCLVMTTEILRSMLYRGSEVVREVALVVYDEIHYLRDSERGVVWEESIILMPKSARLAFLSATIPNAREFAEWVAATHGSPCHVVYTEYRPTPLQHYIFPAGSDGLFMVVDERSVFREDNFQKAVGVLTDANADGGAAAKRTKGAKEPGGKKEEGKATDCYKLVKMLMQRSFDPLIVFSFSKRECETLALGMSSLDLTTDDEKALVGSIFWNAMDALSEEDQKLPQIQQILPMLKRGIGVHHSGLLPIVKEVIEILFQEGLLKVLFATETFSTGLNMPAKTVVFTHARKFDGGTFRWVSSGEYIQMSGRAGRRGLDERGVVVLMLDTKMDPPVAKDMIKGAPDKLDSAFHLGYAMLLNLMRVEGASPEALLGASYRQFQLRRALPALLQKVEALEAERDAVVIQEEAAVNEYYGLLEQWARLSAELRQGAHAAETVLRFLQPGRMARVLPAASDPRAPLPDLGQGTEAGSSGDGAAVMQAVNRGAWGVIISFEKAGKRRLPTASGSAGVADDDSDDADADGNRRSSHSGANSSSAFIVDVLLNCDPSTLNPGSRVLPQFWPPGKKGGSPSVVTLPLSHLDRLSAVRLRQLSDLRAAEARANGMSMVAEVVRRYEGQQMGVPLLDPEADMKVKDKAVRKAASRLEATESRLASHPLANAPDLRQRLAALQAKAALSGAVKAAKRDVKDAQSLVLMEELQARGRVLRRLGYVDAEGLVTMKGRMAAEVQSGDNLVLAEMVFGGAFGGLSAEQIAAVCSCFVWSEKAMAPARLAEDLQAPLAGLRSHARRVGKVAAECKMDVDVDEYVNSFRPELMEAVALWARGSRFADVLKVADVFEGSLVRAVRRLEELLRQLASATKGVGEVELCGRFEDAAAKIRRDVIFSASLYL